jgi:hypothetical protein
MLYQNAEKRNIFVAPQMILHKRIQAALLASPHMVDCSRLDHAVVESNPVVLPLATINCASELCALCS